MSSTEIWHYRGREARGQGKPCIIVDGRMSSAARQAWIEGWQKEEALRNPPPPPTDEEIADSKSFFDSLKAELKNGLKPELRTQTTK
jgi:hypothetical protein